MSDKRDDPRRRQLRRLDLRRETLRTLVDADLAKVAGGLVCRTRCISGCVPPLTE
jgi:hypothetical protein